MNVHILSLVPSPYQRDLFSAMERHEAINLSVHYLEESAPDSPWPERGLARYEAVLPGWTAGRGRVRCHANWNLPDFDGADIVIVNTVLTGVTTQQIMQRLCKRRIPWIFWGEVLRKRTGITGMLQQALTARLSGASAIVAIGSVAKADYQRRFPQTPVCQLPYYCDLTAFSKAAEATTTANTEPVFLYCGQMITRKGIDVLLDAYHSAWKRGLQARLLLVGREAELPGLLKELPDNVRNSVEFAGFQAPEALPELFAKADVFVLPSRHDGWGVVINQALGAGLPVIATHASGAAHDLVEPEINGLIVPPGDSGNLAAALMRLGQCPAMRSGMSAASTAKARQLSPEQGAHSFVEILEEVLEDMVVLSS